MTNLSAPIYLDANATEPLRPQAREAVLAALDLVGNPSSVHAPGRAARHALEKAREVIAAGFGRDADQCVFVSGGTEANALALHTYGVGRRVLIGATEHDAIRRVVRDADILPVTPDGVLDCAVLREKLAEFGPALVCVMAANNETGVLSPLDDVRDVCREFGAHVHVDAVQSAGRLVQDLDGCSVALSGHKMGGPKGAGALLVPDAAPIDALMPGGGQERGRRGGTHAMPAIMGMAAAFEAARQQDWAEVDALRQRVDAAVMALGARIAGGNAPRLPNTSNIILDGVGAQIQLMTLDLAGYAVSAGSACSSGKVSSSHVLVAMGEQEGAAQALRVSLPWNVTAEQVDGFIEAYARMVQRLRKAF